MWIVVFVVTGHISTVTARDGGLYWLFWLGHYITGAVGCRVSRLGHSLTESWDEHTHTHSTALFPGLTGWAYTRKVKPIRILLKQETVSGIGISGAICKSAPRSRQIATPAPHYCVFTGQMPFLLPNQLHESTEGIQCTEGIHGVKTGANDLVCLLWNIFSLVICCWTQH